MIKSTGQGRAMSYDMSMSWDLDPTKSIAEQREQDIIRYLCKSGDLFRWNIPQLLGVDSQILLASHVVRPLRDNRRHKPGDIDLIIVPEGKPDAAIAIECKVVPVVAVDDVEDGHYLLKDKRGRNQYQSMKRGTEQLKALCGLGFHQIYQCVIVATDARNRWGYDIWFREATESVYEKITALRSNENIPDGCGLMTIELVQPSDKQIMYQGAIEPRIQQRAKFHEQRGEITQRIRMLLDAPLDYLTEDRPVTDYAPTQGFPEPTLHLYPTK
jgi:hypothetical protein